MVRFLHICSNFRIMEERIASDVARILDIVIEILKDVHSLKDRHNTFEGEPMLDFSEVCQFLHQSERQVRCYREQEYLIGFTIGKRRMYLLSEVPEFIRRMRKKGKLESLKEIHQ